MSRELGAVARAWVIALVALGVWYLCHLESQPHRVLGDDASPQSFSAVRADAVLARLLGPEIPHPVGSAENAAVRGRIRDEFSKLGVTTSTYRAFTCRSYRGLTFASCATVTDIIAEVAPGQGKAIVLLAHYDSVPAGPGASDDESSVASILETVRALKARGIKSPHPILAVITDGEEGGLLGANAFLQNAALKGRVGAVVNVEARGTNGPSLLFQTSPGDGPLIDLYARSVPVYATSSLYAEIYKVLPNDTDLTLFIRDGFPAFNFAFADNVRYYHSPLDTRANLDPGTLQMQGDNLLGVASGLETADFAKLKGGNDIYLSLQGVFLPRVPAIWALPLSIVIFLVLAAASWIARSNPSPRWPRAVLAVAIPFLLIVLSGISGWLLSLVAQFVSGHPDPTYANPVAMRLALGFAVWALTLFLAQFANFESSAGSAWLWMAFLGVITAAFLPGISPYFLLPALAAAILLAIAAAIPNRWSGLFGQAALCLGMLAAFFVWFPIVVSGETLMGLRLHPLFTIPVAFAMMTAIPLIAAHPMSRVASRASVAVSGIAALVLAVIAGLQPSYSKASPQRVNLIYLENDSEPAHWIADTSWKGIGTEPIPQQLSNAGPFVLDEGAWEGLIPASAYAAPAGTAVDPLPHVHVVQDRREGNARVVDLALRGSEAASGMALYVPKEAQLISIKMRGQELKSDGSHGDTRIACISPDCRDLDVELSLGNAGDVTLHAAEIRYGLPAAGARLQAARPNKAMASQSGDETILATTVSLPAR